MTTNTVEKARAAAEKAAQALAELEAQEAERAAQEAAQRLEREKEAAVRFLADLPALEAQAKGDTVTPADKAKALADGTLASLVADFLARRDVVSALRDRARIAARLTGPDREFAEVRWVDPADELRRWQETAMVHARHAQAGAMTEALLSAYEVA